MNTTALSTMVKIMALLQYLQLHYRCAHWECKGYDLHLLFERLYEVVEEDIDAFAEKTIGIWGPRVSGEILRVNDLTNLMGIMSRSTPTLAHLPRSLFLETMLINQLDRVYAELETSGEMTKGLDDFIMALMSKHEHNLYLIQQSLGND